MTSEARRVAARENGRKSRGPTTPEGKARSSRNALTHGIYRTRRDAVTVGPFAEDPDAVAAVIDEIVESLDPRDRLERFTAVTIARLHVDLERVAAYEVAALQGGKPATSTDQVLSPQQEAIAALFVLERVLQNTTRLTASLQRQLKAATDTYQQLRARILDAADHPDDTDTEVNESPDGWTGSASHARAQARLWDARAEHLAAQPPPPDVPGPELPDYLQVVDPDPTGSPCDTAGTDCVGGGVDGLASGMEGEPSPARNEPDGADNPTHPPDPAVHRQPDRPGKPPGSSTPISPDTERRTRAAIAAARPRTSSLTQPQPDPPART